MDQVWGGRFVTETAVTSRIKQVRRAVGDDGAAQTHVRTSHGRGYRFVADVTEGEAPRPSRHVHEVATTPVIELSLRRRNRDLAGRRPGSAGRATAPSRRDPGGRASERWSRGWPAMSRVIAFSGPDDAALDVLDAAASARAVLLAEGAAWLAAVDLVRQVPQRVAGLVVAGCPGRAARRGRSGRRRHRRTLVLHHADNPDAPVTLGRRLAAALPDAEFRALPGAHDAGNVVDELADLVEEAAADEAAEQTLTALVGLAGPDVDTVADVLVALGGRRRRGPEGDLVVSFDGPANAFRALASRRARGLVDEVGVGVAIDEVSRTSELVSGHGVDVARFFARIAEPGEVLLPNVIKSLLAGSGLTVTTLEPVELPYVGHHPVHRWVRR